MKRLLVLALLCSLFVAWFVWISGPDDSPNFAQTIDSACKSGYTVTDFAVTLDDNLNPVPGLFDVTCTAKRKNQYGFPINTYKTAVQT